MKITKSTWATITGLGLAVIFALAGIDWENFELTPKNKMILVGCVLVAIKGYFTEYKGKKNGTKLK